VVRRWIVVGLAAAALSFGQDPLRRALQLHEKGEYAAAIALYQEYLKAHPEAAAVRSNLGAALVREGRLPEAIRQYRLALKAQPANHAVRFNLGLAHYKSGELDEALREFEAVHKTLPAGDPQKRAAVLLAAECHLRREEDKRAIALLEPLAAADPGDLGVAYLLGTALIHEGDEERGAEMIQRILSRGDTAEAHMLMAFTRLKPNDKKGALAEVDRAIQLNPRLPEAYALRGRILFMSSDLPGAEAAFRSALALDPNAFEPLLFLGTLVRQQGRLDEARTLLERGVRLRPQEIRIRYQHAVLLAALEDDARALALLESLVKDAPYYTEAHRSLSTMYGRMGRPADARREREIADRMDAETQAKDQERGRTLK
jgi:tetratricopeptide (TPR) repeat protein